MFKTPEYTVGIKKAKFKISFHDFQNLSEKKKKMLSIYIIFSDT